MRLFRNYILLAFCMLFVLPISANVSTMGADISYNCVGQDVNGDNQYEFVVNLYYLCESENPPCPGAELQLLVESGTCGESFNFQLPRKNLTGIEVTPLCEVWTDSSTCHNNRFPGVVQYQYTNIDSPFGFLTLPCQSNDWTVSLGDVARNETITNLQNPGSQSLYIEAIINNQVGRCNNSPSFSAQSIPYQIPTTSPLTVPYYCIGLESVFDQGIIETDGDGLSFRLVQPMGAGGVPIPYVDGLGLGSPMLNTAFDFGLGTGQIIFTASEAQNSVITILIEERDLLTGLTIGSVMRDLQFIVIDCDNNQVKAAQDTNKSIEVCPNETARLEIVALDEDIDDLLQVSTDMLNDFPGATLTNNVGSSPLTAIFEWTPTVDDLGLHNVLFLIRDDACPAYSQLTQTYQIKVTQSISVTTTNYTYCVIEPLSVLPIEVGGCGPFSFEPSPIEVIEENGDIIGIIPNPDIDTYTISNAEGDNEQIEIEYIGDFEAAFATDFRVTCGEEEIELDLVFSDENIPCSVSYLKEIESSVESEPCENCPIVSPTETTLYIAVVECENGCKTFAETVIAIESPPSLTLIASEPTQTPNGNLVTVTAMGDFESIEWQTGETSNSVEVLVEESAMIEATAFSPNECSTVRSIVLDYNCSEIQIPSAFTPNDDSVNDEFGIPVVVEELVTFIIYNRWGKPVFSTSDMTEKWDGIVGFEPQPMGIYAYYIESMCGDEMVVNQGFVTLIR